MYFLIYLSTNLSRDLNYISLANVSFAALISLLLPSVKTTVYFHRLKLKAVSFISLAK